MASMFGLSPNEARMIVLGVICSDGQDKIDFDKMAFKGGYSSKASAYVLYRKAKKKLLEINAEGDSNESVGSPMNIASQTTGPSLTGSLMGSGVTTPGTPSRRKVYSTPKKPGTKPEASVTFYDYSSPIPLRVSSLTKPATITPNPASLDVAMCTPDHVNMCDSAPTPKRPRKPRANRSSAPMFEIRRDSKSDSKKRLREDEECSAVQVNGPDIYLPDYLDPKLVSNMPGGNMSGL